MVGEVFDSVENLPSVVGTAVEVIAQDEDTAGLAVDRSAEPEETAPASLDPLPGLLALAGPCAVELTALALAHRHSA